MVFSVLKIILQKPSEFLLTMSNWTILCSEKVSQLNNFSTLLGSPNTSTMPKNIYQWWKCYTFCYCYHFRSTLRCCLSFYSCWNQRLQSLQCSFFKFIPSSYRSFIHFLIPLPFTLNCSGVKVITFWQPQHLWWQTISHRHWDSCCFCPNHLLSRSLGHHHCKKPMVGMFCCGRELGTWWPTLQNYELSKCSTTEMRNGVLPNRNLPDETRNDFNGFPSFVQIRYFDPPVTLWQKPVYFTTRYPEKTNLSLTIVYIW